MSDFEWSCTHCAWCGKSIVRERGYTGSGPDLLCGSTCSGKYWATADAANDLPPLTVGERLEILEEFDLELPDFDE